MHSLQDLGAQQARAIADRGHLPPCQRSAAVLRGPRRGFRGVAFGYDMASWRSGGTV